MYFLYVVSLLSTSSLYFYYYYCYHYHYLLSIYVSIYRNISHNFHLYPILDYVGTMTQLPREEVANDAVMRCIRIPLSIASTISSEISTSPFFFFFFFVLFLFDCLSPSLFQRLQGSEDSKGKESGSISLVRSSYRLPKECRDH